jgi:predicted fused transcriptional regulator/phosphomethylpyrimidine kinase
VRGGVDVAAKAKALGWRVHVVKRAPGSPDESILLQAIAGNGRTSSRVAAANTALDAVHDPGAIGLEPCLYIAGPDAQSVARKILALDQVLL